MYCLVYQSEASPALVPADIESLLVKARAFNHDQGITGCLLYFRGVFLQYLEGNQLKVLSLYDLIREDRRHSDVKLLSHSQIKKREFKDWDMAYENFYGDNELINYLKLVVINFLEDPLKRLSPNPSSVQFWDHVSRMLSSG